MVKLRKKKELEEVSAASMSDIAFLLLVFFMVASVFYVKEGLSSSLPKKKSQPRLVLKEQVYIFKVRDAGFVVEHPSIRKLEFKNREEFSKGLAELKIDDLNKKFALLQSSPKTSVQDMITIMSLIKKRGFKHISLQRIK